MAESIFFPDYDITLDQANPEAIWAGSEFLLSGLYISSTPPSIYRSLLHFDISSLPENAIIKSCFLNLYACSAVDCGVKDLFTPYLVNSPWSESTKWGTQPGINYSIRGSFSSICEAGFIKFNILPIVKYWINANINNGLVLKSTETIEYSSKTFYSHNELFMADLRPFIEIVYNDAVPTLSYKRNFEDIVASVPTFPTEQSTSSIDVSDIFEYTIFIKNLGNNSINVHLDVGPDDSSFVLNCSTKSLSPYETSIIVSKYFSKYIRLRYYSANGVSSLKYWILKQS